MTRINIKDTPWHQNQLYEITHGTSLVGFSIDKGEKSVTMAMSADEARDLAVRLEYEAMLLDQEMGVDK